MTDAHDDVAEWDAAYVMGALSPAERRIFEDHLARCATCRAAVATLAPTVGLLSRVPAERARAIGDDQPGPEPQLRDQLMRTHTRRRGRRRNVWTLAAAGALILGGIAVPVAVATAPAGGEVHALQDLGGAPLEASVRLTTVGWGTEIDLVCRYTGEQLDAPEDGFPYALAVVARDGTTTTLSTWRATPGSTTQLSAGVDLSVGDIDAVEIRRLDDSQAVVMRYESP
ncbi:anti-sigma factor family protein [Microbacterium sp. NPDC091313]